MKSKKKLLIGAAVLLFLGAILTAVWVGCDWPPPRLILNYGLPPAGGPTGRRLTVEGIEFIELRPGYFRMGSGSVKGTERLTRLLADVFRIVQGEPATDSGEPPGGWTEIPASIWMSRTEITVDLYARFDGEHTPLLSPGRPSVGSRPVSGVSWLESVAYCSWLAERTGLDARLPWEREWEYCCRAGSRTPWSFGDDAELLLQHAWFWRNSGKTTLPVDAPYSALELSLTWKAREHDVGRRQPNSWGFNDLHGNVAEWCADSFSRPKEPAPQQGPFWSGLRIVRGGSWISQTHATSSFHREYFPEGLRCEVTGIRLVVGAQCRQTPQLKTPERK